MDIKGKTLQADPYVIKFFLSDYEVSEEVNILTQNKNIIFTGKLIPGIKSTLEMNTKSYILTRGTVDRDLTDSKELIKFVFEIKGKEPQPYILEQADLLDYKEILYFCKVYHVTGKWLMKKMSDGGTFLDLYKTSVEPLTEQLKVYYSIKKSMPVAVVESAYLTFIKRGSNLSDTSINYNYKQLIKKFLSKSGNRVRPVVLEHLNNSGYTHDMRFLAFLINMRGWYSYVYLW